MGQLYDAGRALQRESRAREDAETSEREAAAKAAEAQRAEAAQQRAMEGKSSRELLRAGLAERDAEALRRLLKAGR